MILEKIFENNIFIKSNEEGKLKYDIYNIEGKLLLNGYSILSNQFGFCADIFILIVVKIKIKVHFILLFNL